MKTYLCLGILLCFINTNLFAQKTNIPKVTIKDLEEKSHYVDSSATACMLYNKGKTTFAFNEEDGFSAVHEFEIRIKIFKNEGLKYANYQIPYYVGYENIEQDISNVVYGNTYNLVDGKIEKTKLTDEGKFKISVNENWKTINITLPNVKVGSIIEFKYVIKSQNILTFPTFYFQNEIPVDYAEYKTEIPIYYIYRPIITGFINIETKEEINSGYKNFEDKYKQTQKIEYKQISSIHIAKDVPALKPELYVDNLDNYKSGIDHELQYIKSPDKPDKDLSRTWDGVAKAISENKNFGKQLNERNYFEPILNSITKDLVTELERTEAILRYLKSRIKWNNKFGIYTDNGVKKAFENRTGNIAEINFILVAMLNAEGINANPVLVSTINNGVAVFPNQTAYNYIVACAEIDGKKILLDAADKNSFLNILPTFTLNWKGRLLKGNQTSEEIDMVPSFLSKNNINFFGKIDKSGTITGKVKIYKYDYEAYTHRDKYEGLNKDNYLEKLENQYNLSAIQYYDIENEANLDKPIIETFDFVTNNQADILDNTIYIKPALFFAQTKNPFLNEERKLPVYFGYPEQNKWAFNLEIPEGYYIESLPKPIILKTEEGIANFKFNIQAVDNKIQMVFNFEIEKMLVSADYYQTIKEFFQKMIDKHNEKIIIKKK